MGNAPCKVQQDELKNCLKDLEKDKTKGKKCEEFKVLYEKCLKTKEITFKKEIEEIENDKKKGYVCDII